MYICKPELFEVEMIICIKMDLALNKPQRLICLGMVLWLICHKSQTTNQPYYIWVERWSLSKMKLVVCIEYYWSLTIRLFRVTSRIPVGVSGGSYPSAEAQSVYSIAPADGATKTKSLSKFRIIIYKQYLNLLDTVCKLSFIKSNGPTRGIR